MFGQWMLILAFGFTLTAIFGLGRFVCPPADRLRLRELDLAGLVTTFARGWAVLASSERAERISRHFREERRRGGEDGTGAPA